MNLLLERYPAAWDMSPPPAAGQSVFVRLVPEFASVLDYTQGFGHTELAEIGAGDLGAAAFAGPSAPRR